MCETSLGDARRMGDDGTRLHVLLTAGQVFAERGFEGATVRSICARAEVNLASVNYYFGDKANLYFEAVRTAHETRAGEVPMPVWTDDVSAEQRLREFVRTLLWRMLGDRELPWQSRLLMREMLHPTPGCARVLGDFIRPQHEMLIGIIVDLSEARVHRDRLHQLAFSVIGQCMFYRMAGGIIELLLDDSENVPPYSIETLVDHIVEFTLGGIARLTATSRDSTAVTEIEDAPRNLKDSSKEAARLAPQVDPKEADV